MSTDQKAIYLFLITKCTQKRGEERSDNIESKTFLYVNTSEKWLGSINLIRRDIKQVMRNVLQKKDSLLKRKRITFLVSFCLHRFTHKGRRVRGKFERRTQSSCYGKRRGRLLCISDQCILVHASPNRDPKKGS